MLSASGDFNLQPPTGVLPLGPTRGLLSSISSLSWSPKILKLFNESQCNSGTIIKIYWLKYPRGAYFCVIKFVADLFQLSVYHYNALDAAAKARVILFSEPILT